MSDSFEVQVRDLLAGRVAAAPAAHGWEAVERRASGPGLPASSGGSRPTVVVWLAVAAAVVLLVAGAVFVVGDDDDSVVIDEGPSTTLIDEPEPTVDQDEPDEGALTVDEVDSTDDGTADAEPDAENETVSGSFAPIEPGTWHVAAARDSSITAPEGEDLAAQVRSWPGVLSVEAASNASDWHRLTGLGDSSCDGARSGPPCGVGVVLLVVEGQQEAIGRRLESELAMVTLSAHASPVEFVAGYFAAAVDRASPVPLRFDPTSLGREIPLTGPITDITEHPDCVEPDCAVVDEIAVEVDIDGTIERFRVAIADPPRLLLSGTGQGSGQADIESLLPGPGGAAGISALVLPSGRGAPGRGVVVVAGLPLDAAVVTVSLSDGSTVWQRPLAGMAVAPGVPLPSEGIDVDSDAVTTVSAFDAGGNEILVIDASSSVFETVVTDLRVNSDQLLAAERKLARAFERDGRTVDAGEVAVTWTEATWGPDEGPDGDRLRWTVATPSGLLALGEVGAETGVVWRWTDARRWERAAELRDYDIHWLAKGGDRVVASGRRRGNVQPTQVGTTDDQAATASQPVVLSSFDGETWTDLDRSALASNWDNIVATSSSGVSIVGHETRPGIVALIEEDRIVETYDPPWPTPDLSGGTWLPHFFEVFDTDDGAVVVRFFYVEDEDGSTVAMSEAHRYLGDGQFAAPVTIPVSERTAQLGDTMLRFERADYLPAFGDVAEVSEALLLSSANGIDWTNHSTLTSKTNHGLRIDSGDFFWVYGLVGGFYTLRRSDSITTIWISTDAVNWSPLDISFTDSQSFVKIVGDTIFIYDNRIDDYWIGQVEPR